jgi:hypothetical protein
LAQIYKSKLEAAGLPVLLKYEALGLVYGLTVDGLGEVRIMVPQAYAEEAEALLADVQDAQDEEWGEVGESYPSDESEDPPEGTPEPK